MPDPPDPGGPIDALNRAMANAPDAAMQGLQRARERVREAWETVMQNTSQLFGDAGDVVRDGVPDFAGQVTGTIAPIGHDLLAHLPEVIP